MATTEAFQNDAFQRDDDLAGGGFQTTTSSVLMVAQDDTPRYIVEKA